MAWCLVKHRDNFTFLWVGIRMKLEIWTDVFLRPLVKPLELTSRAIVKKKRNMKHMWDANWQVK